MPLGDFHYEMVNFRRVLVSLATGSLLLIAVGAQAGAVESDTAGLAIAERGLALGLQAAQEIETDAADGILEGEGFGNANEALKTVLAKLELKTNNGNGRGPERAIQVHQALLNGELPSSIVHDDDSIPGLAKAYGHMRSQLKGEGRSPNANPGPPATPAP